MARQPRSPITIVDVNSLLSVAQRYAERWNIFSLDQQISDTGSCLRWLASRQLINNSMECSRCHQLAALYAHSQGGDGRRWKCSPCRATYTVRRGSFFETRNLTLRQIILIMYYWTVGYPSNIICREVDVSANIIVEYFNHCREECGRWLGRNPPEIGGFQENGDPVVVEIGGRKFFHRKYQRGRWQEDHWVFGGVERGSGKCFLAEVPDCTAGTVEDVIQQYILPGSHIISDDREAFKNISMLKGGIYLHSVVLHGHQFVNPEDTEVHTQTIKNMWMRAKKKMRHKFGTWRISLASYLDEFVWRSTCRDDDPFSSFLICLSENYGL